jgi:lysophospholipase L1-like esterase
MFKRWMQCVSTFVLVAGTLILGTTSACAARAPQEQAPTQWIGTWASAPMASPSGNNACPFCDSTLREIVHISAGGDKIRIRFTNEFGSESLKIANVHVALSAGEGTLQPGTDHVVTFNGVSSVQIPQGAALYSDPVALHAPALANLAITFYVPQQTMRSATYHALASETNYIASGDATMQATLANAKTTKSWYFVDGVDVPATKGSFSIVTLGDSITDGARSTIGANRRWPDVLAARLQKEKGFEHVGVLNVGISGNRVLNEGAGPSALSRVSRDVLAQNGVRYVILLESINDIGHMEPKHRFSNEAPITAEDLKWGLRQIADQAHQHGIKIIGATLTPYMTAGYSFEQGEKMRAEVNTWIRTSGVFDGVIDFEKIAGDGANPPRFNPAFDSGDHLHPSDVGYKAMGEGIDLKLFK